MAGSNSQYSIILDAILNEESIKKQLKQIQNSKDTEIKFKVGADGLDKVAKHANEAADATKRLNDSGEDLELTFNVANEVFSKFSDVIRSMVGQVYELDDALTEFKKVSDLAGSELDSYVDKLSKIGQTVGRTGKPNRSEPVCCDGKAA